MKKLLYLYNDGHNAFPHIKGGAIFETYEDDDEGGEILRRHDDGNRDDTNIYANNISHDYDDEVIGSVIYEPDGDRHVNYIMSPFTEADSDVIPSYRFNADGDDIDVYLRRDIAQKAEDERERELYGELDYDDIEFDDSDEINHEIISDEYDVINSFKQDILKASTVAELKKIKGEIISISDQLKSKLLKSFSKDFKSVKNADEWYNAKVKELDDFLQKSEEEKKKATSDLHESITGLAKILVGILLIRDTDKQLIPEGKQIIDNFFKSTIEKQVDKQIKDLTTKNLSDTDLLTKTRKLAPTLYNLVKKEIESKNIKSDLRFNSYIFDKLFEDNMYVPGRDKKDDTVRGQLITQFLVTIARNVLNDKISTLPYKKDKYLDSVQKIVDKNASAIDTHKAIDTKTTNDLHKKYKSDRRDFKSTEYALGLYNLEKKAVDEKIKKINKERVRKEAPMIVIPKEVDPSIVREEKPTKKEGLSKGQKKKMKKQLDVAVTRLKTMVPHSSGPLLEDYLSKDGSNILNIVTEDKSPIINNMDNKNIPDVEVDINGENVSLRSASTLDAYNNDNVFEIKNYNLNSQSDNIPIQLSKLQGTPIFTPFYLSNGRLYNIEVGVVDTNGVRHMKNIYPTNEKGREIYMIYKLNDGLYKYKPMEGEDVKLKAVQATTKGGKQLYVYHGSSLKPTIDIYGNKSLIVPRDKLIKI